MLSSSAVRFPCLDNRAIERIAACHINGHARIHCRHNRIGAVAVLLHAPFLRHAASVATLRHLLTVLQIGPCGIERQIQIRLAVLDGVIAIAGFLDFEPLRIGTVGAIQLYSGPCTHRPTSHIHNKIVFQGRASHICSSLECVLVNLEVLGDRAAVVAFSLDRHRCCADIHIVTVRKRVIRAFLQHRTSCHNRRLRLLRAAGISPVGNASLHNCGVQPNRRIRKRD